MCCVACNIVPGCRRRPFIKDPTSLIPQLPKPQDLRPFPHKLLLRFLGHTGSVSLSDATDLMTCRTLECSILTQCWREKRDQVGIQCPQRVQPLLSRLEALDMRSALYKA